MSQGITFSPQLLNNSERLRAYFCESYDRSSIETLSKNPALIQVPTKDSPYFGRWKMTWVCVSSIFYWLTSCVCCLLAKLCDCLYLRTPSRFLTIASKHLLRDVQQVDNQNREGEKILVPAFNAHKLFSGSVYNRDPIPTSQIINPEIFIQTLTYGSREEAVKREIDNFFTRLEKKGHTIPEERQKASQKLFLEKYAINKDLLHATERLYADYRSFSPKELVSKLYFELLKNETFFNISNIELYSTQGVCRGASSWFIILYEQTKDLFDDPIEHLIAVAEQFRTGISEQGAILQGFYQASLNAGLVEIENEEVSITGFELDRNDSSAQEKIGQTPNGIYRVGVYNHSLVYVRLDKAKEFLWDPNVGLIRLEPGELYTRIREKYYIPGVFNSMIQLTSVVTPEKVKELEETA